MHTPDAKSKEGKDLLLSAFASIGDGVIVTDRQGAVLYVNIPAQKLTGWSAKKAHGKPFSEVFPLVDAFSGKRLDSPLAPVLEHGKTAGLRDRSALHQKNGKLVFVAAKCAPMREDGEIAGAVVVFRDINRIKSVEEEVKREKDNLTGLLRALPLGVLVAGQDAVVKWVNKPFSDMFHIKASAIKGRRFGDVARCVYSREKGCGQGEGCAFCQIRQNITAAIRQGVSRRNVVLQQAFSRQGSALNLWLKISFIPLNAPGEKQVVIAIEDISEQKHYEAALQESRDAADTANRLKSELLANMSHEIRTPLNGMIGMMDLLQLSEPSGEQKEYIRMAKMSANSLLKVLSDILDFSRIESGKVLTQSISFDIKALTEEIMKVHAVLAREKGLKAEYSFARGIPRCITGDPDRLRQILNNLLGNAVKFTDQGRVKLAVRKAGMAGPNIGLEFAVSDTGIGIPEDKQDLLFQRFSQVDGSKTRRYSGTGLGLAISKQLAQMMGGSIRLASEPGKGSTFLLALEFKLGAEPPKGDVSGFSFAGEQSPSPIILDDSEKNEMISKGTMNEPGRTVILENQDNSERYSRVRLSKSGEIVFDAAGEAAAADDVSLELAELEQVLRAMRAVLRESRFARIEETAHKVKKIALKINDDGLMDMAFKTELAARKGNWAAATNYCLKIMDEFHARYQGGARHEDIDRGR